MNDILFDLHIEDWIQENLFFLGEYEANELDCLQRLLKKGGVFVDIGANIGLFTLCASKLVGEHGRVVSFEPFEENFQRLKHNLSLNKVKNAVVEKLAISQTQGNISIACDEKEANNGMASAYLKELSISETVEATSLDAYFTNHPTNKVDFIKIDIEGGEFPALLGMQETIKRYGPAILIEIKDSILSNTPYTKEDILQFFQEQGYVKHKSLNETDAGKEMIHNFLFLKENIG